MMDNFVRKQLVVLGVLAWGAGAAVCATTTDARLKINCLGLGAKK